MALPVLSLGDDVEGVVVRDPPLVALHLIIDAADIRGAAVAEGFLTLPAQHLQRLRDVGLRPAVESRVAGHIPHQLREAVLHLQLGVLVALFQGVLPLIQEEVQECLPHGIRYAAPALLPLAPLVDQAVQVVGPHRVPAAV